MLRVTIATRSLFLVLCGAPSFAAQEDVNYQLYDSVLYGDTEMLGELLAKGADANHVEGGRSVLIWAAQSGLVEVAEALPAAGADINSVDDIGQTALTRAIEILDIPMVTTLLTAEPDLEVVDADGRTVAMIVSELGRPDIAQLLIAAGADFNVRDADGNSTVMLTMMSAGDEQFDIIKLLGAAAVNLDHGNADYTALSYAVEQGNAPLEGVARGGSGP